MTRCRGCWNFVEYCSCVLDALDAELPNRCCVCGNRWTWCTCTVRRELLSDLSAIDHAVARVDAYFQWYRRYTEAEDLRLVFDDRPLLRSADADSTRFFTVEEIRRLLE